MRPARIRPEFLRGHIIDEAMLITVAADLMPASGDLPDQIRVPLGKPSQDKESGLDPVFVQQVKDPHRAYVNPALEAAPIPRTDSIGERGYHEVILHIHREYVRDPAHREVPETNELPVPIGRS